MANLFSCTQLVNVKTLLNYQYDEPVKENESGARRTNKTIYPFDTVILFGRLVTYLVKLS